MKKVCIYRTQRGVGSIEVVIGVTIASLIILFSVNAITRFITLGADQVERVQALYLAEEALEATRFLHDENWSDITSLTNGTTYYIDFSGSTIEATTTPILIDGIFSQTFVLTEVYRAISDDDIVASTSPESKIIDTDTRFVTANVAWEGASATTTLEQYLADITE